MDLVQLTRKPPTAPPPPNVDYVIFLTIFYRSFPIFRHIFTLKVKKIRETWIRTETPPPHCGLNPFFFVFVFFNCLMSK